jgi:hypothetical protein
VARSRGRARRLRRAASRPVLGPGSDDAAQADAGPHQGDQVGPHPGPAFRVDVATGPERRDPVPEQQLGAVDVAHAGEHRLVHQQGADRRPAAGDAPVGARAVGAGPQRIGTEPGEDPVHLRGGQHLAGGGAAQVGPHPGAVRSLAFPAHPQCSASGRGSSGTADEGSVEAQVHVHRVGAEPGEQVLAVGEDLVEDPAVEQRGTRREPALRAGQPHRPAGEQLGLLPREAVEGVSFRHRRSVGARGQRATISRPKCGRFSAATRSIVSGCCWM